MAEHVQRYPWALETNTLNKLSLGRLCAYIRPGIGTMRARKMSGDSALRGRNARDHCDPANIPLINDVAV